MKEFVTRYPAYEIESPDFKLYFHNMNACVFDIETTGLSPATAKVIMTAMMMREGDDWVVTQYLAENHFEEEKVLLATIDYFEKNNVDYLITYNGANFDIPFVNKRLEVLNHDYRINMYDLDLYRFIRRETILGINLASLSQKSIEKYYGISKERDDVIDGGESVKLYEEYALTGDAKLEEMMLTHNREDVYQLGRILSILALNNFREYLTTGDFHKSIAHYGFPIDGGRLVARIELKPRSRQLVVSGTQLNSAFDALFFSGIDHLYNAEFVKASKFFEVIIPLEEKNASYYVNTKALEINNKFQELDNCVNDYLILVDNGVYNHHSINSLCNSVLLKILED